MPVEPLTVVRYVVLAKASSIVGALFAGFFGAVTIWLLGSRGPAGAAVDDLPPAIGGLVGAIVLLVGALLLERACRVPPQPEKTRRRVGRSEAAGSSRSAAPRVRSCTVARKRGGVSR